MPNIREMKDSKFLKKEDCGRGILLTIRDCQQENVAMDGEAQDLRWCLFFAETEKPLVLNTTNCEIIAQVCGSEETDEWKGKKIVLFSDPNVTFKGKLVGGIRARAPRALPGGKASPAPAATAAPAAPEDTDDDIPF